MAFRESETESEIPNDLKDRYIRNYHDYAKTLRYKIYSVSYGTGKFAIEFILSFSKRISGFFHFIFRQAGRLFSAGRRGFTDISGLFNGKNDWFVLRKKAVKEFYSALLAEYRRFRVEYGAFRGTAEFLRLCAGGVASWIKRHKKMLNYAAPVVGIAILSATVMIWAGVFSQNGGSCFALRVSYNGKPLGMIKSQTVFDSAIKKVEGNIRGASGSAFQFNDVPQYNLVIARRSDLVSGPKLDNRIIKSAGNAILSGYGLYVDGVLVGENTSEESIQGMLDSILAPYRAASNGDEVGFVQDVQIKKGIFPKDCAKTVDEMQFMLTSGTGGGQEYVVKKGDSAAKIADKFKIPVTRLLYLNPVMNSNKLPEGSSILVEPATEPYLNIKIVKKETSRQKVPFKTVSTPDPGSYVGQNKVEVNGADGAADVIQEVTYVDGAVTDEQVVSQTIVKPATDQVILTGSKPKPSTVASGTFMRPIAEGVGYVSCPFGGYKGHTGMDIACSEGTPIMAADAGTVVFAGWGGGYGNCVMIDHGNGMLTIYGHSSKLLVTQGTKVYKGQVIALVGQTGNATGNHVHFEIRINGVAVNPAPFIK